MAGSILFVVINLSIGFFLSYFVQFIGWWVLYIRILQNLKHHHANDLTIKYGINPAEDAILKYDSVVGTSFKFLLPGYIDWKFWRGPRPSWSWEFMKSKEDFGDASLASLQKRYLKFNWKYFFLYGVLIGIVCLILFSVLISKKIH